MLLPTNMAPIKSDGFFKNPAIKRALSIPCLLLSSTLNLLAEKKAISIPEKKAESTRLSRMIKITSTVVFGRQR